MKSMLTLAAALALSGFVLAATPAAASDTAGSFTSSADSGQAMPLTEADADGLTPGQYLWQPNVAATGPIAIDVDLQRQIAFVRRGDALIGIATVSGGREGHETPVGTFPILQKQVEHHSNLYNEAAMPFMERLTWDGVALHSGGVPGHPSSHGCVHLPDAFAQLLYGVTDIGAVVTITDGDRMPADPTGASTIVTAEADPAPAASPHSHAAP